jgi:phage-related protein
LINFTFGDNNFNAVAGADGFVLGRVGFLTPDREYRSEKIPGRNAPLTIDGGRWETVEGYYQCFIQSGYDAKKNDIQFWLDKYGGAFTRLEDTAEPTIFRMARFKNPIREVKVLHGDIARFDVYFECSAERWLKSGATATTVTSGSTITNPTAFNSLPRIRVNGSGDFTMTINGKTASFTDNNSGITIDSEICRAYNGSTPKDSSMTGDFPVLVPGDNTISWSGSGITSVTVTPRWWTI